MAEKKLGDVTHWYDKIKVAVVKLAKPLKKGDKVKVRRNDEEFDAEVKSIQIEHEDVEKGKKGDEIAVKLPKQAKEGSELYKAE